MDSPEKTLLAERKRPERSLAVALAVLFILACGPKRPRSTPNMLAPLDHQNDPAEPTSLTESTSLVVAFAPLAPTAIKPCEREPSVLVTQVPLEGNFPRPANTPEQFALKSHSFYRDGQLTLFVPESHSGQWVSALTALQFDVGRGQWLSPVRHELPNRHLVPANEIEVSEYDRGFRVMLGRPHMALTFSNGRFATEEIPGHARRMYHDVLVAHRPGPEPRTGIEVSIDHVQHKALLKRGEKTLGSVEFPQDPGVFVGVFSNSRRALLWGGALPNQATTGSDLSSSDGLQGRTTTTSAHHGYLVDIDSGVACAIGASLPYSDYAPTMVFRTGATFIVLNIQMTEMQRRSQCPRGAPCLPPRPPQFAGARVIVVRDAEAADGSRGK